MECDFKPHAVEAEYVGFVGPEEVFRLSDPSEDFRGVMMVVPLKFISSAVKVVFAHHLVDDSPFWLPLELRATVWQLLGMLEQKTEWLSEPAIHREFVQHAAMACIKVLTEALVRNIMPFMSSVQRTNLPVIIRLHDLFDEHLKLTRQPYYYAELLDVTPSYLNELVKSVVGTSISLYLRMESTRRICRSLVMTNDSIHDIAQAWNYDDPAYFTRMFTKITGMTPSKFRANYRRG